MQHEESNFISFLLYSENSVTLECVENAVIQI